MYNIHLSLSSDTRVDIGVDSLTSIVQFLPDQRGSQMLFDFLATSDSATVRQAVASKSLLSDKTVDVLSGDSTLSVRLALLSNDAANQRIEESRIAEWIAGDDVDLLLAILQNLTSMPQLDAKALLRQLSGHRDPSIRLEVARSTHIDFDLAKILHADADPDVREAASDWFTAQVPIDEEDWEK